jgi:hypothetical protein
MRLPAVGIRHRRRFVRALQILRHLGLRGVGEQLARLEVEDAVAQRGDLEVAEHHPVVARRLGLDLRRPGLRAGHEEQRAGK